MLCILNMNQTFSLHLDNLYLDVTHSTGSGAGGSGVSGRTK